MGQAALPIAGNELHRRKGNEMKPMTTQNLDMIEARARQLRAQAIGEVMQALRLWIAARWAGLRGAAGKTQAG